MEKCYIKKKNGWFLIDTVNRIINRTTNGTHNSRGQYPLVICKDNECLSVGVLECDRLRSDIDSEKITMLDYLEISRMIKKDGCVYNKKRGCLMKRIQDITLEYVVRKRGKEINTADSRVIPKII